MAAQTPTPWRFILPSRATQPSPNPTPTPRFQSTPRFGTSSVARSRTGNRRLRHDDIEENEDEVHESSFEDDGGCVDVDTGMEWDDDRPELQGKRQLRQRESIEPASSSWAETSEEIQISPQVTPPAPRSPGSSQDTLGLTDVGPQRSTPFIQQRDNKRQRLDLSSPEASQARRDSPASPYDSDIGGQSCDEDGDLQSFEDVSEVGEREQQQQPTFNAPPRFKPLQADAETEGLPIAFSPQRKGVKYVPGGLASQLQGWLSEVKGWEGVESSHPDPILKATIEELRPGRRMYLALARLEPEGQVRRFILAGEGRLTGLGQRAELGIGSIVNVVQPVWDAELEGETWIVACDWQVE